MARLPFVQVDTDFITHGAAALAAVLGGETSPAVAGWAVLQLRTWALSRADGEDLLGFIPGANAARLVATFAGWRGDPAVFLAALCDPAVSLAEVCEDGVQLLGLDRDAAAVRKGRGDRERMSRRRRGDVSERSRDVDGKTQTQTQTQTQKEEAASQAPASAAPPPGDDLPDAADDAQPVAEERPTLVLHVQPAEKKPRAPAPGVALYARLEDRRQKACTEDVVPYVPSRWAFSRQNRELGPIAKAETSNPEEWERFRGAWQEFVDDPESRNLDVPYSLDWFMRCRSRYEGRALKAAGGGA
jgi:hypothetical protein